MSDIAVEITGLHKSFGSLEVLRGIDLVPANGLAWSSSRSTCSPT
jgi:ABC-type histidine transport system ATPase subunit